MSTYTRAYVAPRPERADFKTEAAYIAARDEWKKEYPNLHTAEEQAAHLAWRRTVS